MSGRVRLQDADHTELRSRRTSAPYSLSAVESAAWGLRDLFVHHDIVPPGRAMSAPHRHTASEELVVVLEGQVVAIRGDERTVLEAGDALGFPPSDPRPHVVVNESAEPARVLVVASTRPDDRVETQRTLL